MDPVKMYFLLKMGIFHCHVSLLEDTDMYDPGLRFPNPPPTEEWH